MTSPNADAMSGKLKEWKGEFQKKWGKFTNDELEKTKGDISVISGLVQQKYGMAKDEALKTVREFMEKFSDKKQDPPTQTPLV